MLMVTVVKAILAGLSKLRNSRPHQHSRGVRKKSNGIKLKDFLRPPTKENNSGKRKGELSWKKSFGKSEKHS